MSHTQLIISLRLKHKIDKYVRYVKIVNDVLFAKTSNNLAEFSCNNQHNSRLKCIAYVRRHFYRTRKVTSAASFTIKFNADKFRAIYVRKPVSSDQMESFWELKLQVGRGFNVTYITIIHRGINSLQNMSLFRA